MLKILSVLIATTILLTFRILMATGDSGWVYGGKGLSCTQVCNQQSPPLPCHLPSLQNAVVTGAQFEDVKTQNGLTISCNVLLASTVFSPAYTNVSYYGGSCVLGGRRSTCDGSSPSINRICCCSVNGCRVSCPLSEWGEWTACNNCGSRVQQTRTRAIPSDCTTQKSLSESRSCQSRG